MNELFVGKTRISNEAVNSSYDYSAAEIDLFIKVLFLLQKEKNAERNSGVFILKMNYDDFISNISGASYELIRGAFMQLIKKPIEIYFPDEKRYFISSLINTASFYKNSGKIEIEVNAKIAALLLDIKSHYTNFQIETILKLRGKYAKRLYILLSQFIGSGKIDTGVRYVNLEDLKKVLKLGDKYEKIADFKKRVIEPAIFEINQLSELVTSYEQNKNSRQITDLIFKIQYKQRVEDSAGYEKQRAYMVKCGVATWIIDNAIQQLTPADLHSLCYKFSLKAGEVKNKGAYFTRMLETAGVNTRNKIPIQIKINYEN